MAKPCEAMPLDELRAEWEAGAERHVDFKQNDGMFWSLVDFRHRLMVIRYLKVENGWCAFPDIYVGYDIWRCLNYIADAINAS